MEYRELGRTGVKVSPLCLGTMNFPEPSGETESIEIINHALDGGINFLDTANVYNQGESEKILGRALEENGRRDEVVLATKVYGRMGDGPNESGVSRYHIIKACEDSLRRLRTDRIDLYQLHRPGLTVPQDEAKPSGGTERPPPNMPSSPRTNGTDLNPLRRRSAGVQSKL